MTPVKLQDSMGHGSQDIPLSAPAVPEPPKRRRQTPKASEEVFEETSLFDTLLEMGLPKLWLGQVGAGFNVFIFFKEFLYETKEFPFNKNPDSN